MEIVRSLPSGSYTATATSIIGRLVSLVERESRVKCPKSYFLSAVDESLGREKRSVYILGLREETRYILKISATNDAGKTEVIVKADTLGSLRKFLLQMHLTPSLSIPRLCEIGVCVGRTEC
jgi:hypothetical protein